MKRVSPLLRTVRRAMSCLTQPQREREQPRGEDRRAPGEPRAEQTRADDDENDREQPLGDGRGRQEARQLEPLAGDREDQEGEPPVDDLMHGRARRPEDVAGGPGERAERQREREERALPAEDVDRRREQHEASGDEQPGRDRSRARDPGKAAGAGEAAGRDRPTGAPIATARSSAITTPKKPQIISGPCSDAAAAATSGTLQPSRASPAPVADEEADEAEDQQRQPRERRDGAFGRGVHSRWQARGRLRARSRARRERMDAGHPTHLGQNVQPKCSLAMPVILSGVQGGSQTRRTSTAVPSGTIAPITSRAWSTIMSAIGQAAVVIVMSTRDAPGVDFDPVDEAEVDDVHAGLGVLDLAQRFAHASSSSGSPSTSVGSRLR